MKTWVKNTVDIKNISNQSYSYQIHAVRNANNKNDNISIEKALHASSYRKEKGISSHGIFYIKSCKEGI